MWAADNDAYSAWDELRYRQMLNAIKDLPPPLFVTLPDVVGDAAATLLLAFDWHRQLRRRDLPIALVAQDGLTVKTTPWEALDALFIGGSTEFKMSDTARRLTSEAKERGLWVHMGRVNGHRRLRFAKAIGCDSVDGTSLSWFRDTYLREFLEHAAGPTQLMVTT